MQYYIDWYVIYSYVNFTIIFCPTLQALSKNDLVDLCVRLDMQDIASCLVNKNVKLSSARVHAELIEYRLRVL
jgi:hypothetical protein